MKSKHYICIFTYVIVSLLNSVIAQECAVGSEGSSIRLLCVVSSNVNKLITWQVDKGGRYVDITTCHIHGACTTNSPDFYAFMTGTNCTIHLKSLSRNLSSWRCVWDDVHIGPPCNITVYVPPMKPICDTPTFVNSNTAVSVTCRTIKTFPVAQCHFIQYTNTTALNNTRVVHKHSQSPVSSQDYRTECTFVSDLLPLSQPVSITIGIGMISLPNTNIVYGGNITVDLFFPVPELDVDCPHDYIMSGITASCTCKLASACSPPGQTHWFSTNVAKYVTFSKNNGASQLDFYFNSSVQDPIFYCYSTSTIGQPQNTLIFEPKFAFGPSQVYFEALTSPEFQLTNSSSVLLRCNVSKDQVLPSVVFNYDVNNHQLLNWPHHSDGSFYTSNLVYNPESPGAYNVTCRVQNVKFPKISAQNTLNIMAFGGTAQVTLDILSPLEVDICSRTVIPVSCNVGTGQVYPGTTSVLYINNEEHQARTTYERDAIHALTVNFIPSSVGKFEIRCSVVNNHTSTLLAEEIIFLNVTGGSCGISSISFGLSVGLGCAVFVLMIVILTFALWRRRKTVAKRQEKQTAYFTVGNNQVKVIVQSNAQEPPPDYMSHTEYDRRTYLPRVSTQQKNKVNHVYDNPNYMRSDSSSYLFLNRQSSTQDLDNNIYSTVDG